MWFIVINIGVATGRTALAAGVHVLYCCIELRYLDITISLLSGLLASCRK